MAPAFSGGTVAQIVCAPDRPEFHHVTRLFLAGTTPPDDGTGKPPVDWRQSVRAAVSDMPVTVFDPLRPDWDDTWTEDPDFHPFRQQVDWELEMQEQATLIAFFFDPGREGHISLMELGLCASRKGTQQAIVGCPPGYKKRGNVQMVCARHGILLVDSAEALAEALAEAVRASLVNSEQTKASKVRGETHRGWYDPPHTKLNPDGTPYRPDRDGNRSERKRSPRQNRVTQFWLEPSQDPCLQDSFEDVRDEMIVRRRVRERGDHERDENNDNDSDAPRIGRDWIFVTPEGVLAPTKF